MNLSMHATHAAIDPSCGFGNFRAKDVVEPTDLDVALVFDVGEVNLIAFAGLGVELKQH